MPVTEVGINILTLRFIHLKFSVYRNSAIISRRRWGNEHYQTFIEEYMYYHKPCAIKTHCTKQRKKTAFHLKVCWKQTVFNLIDMFQTATCTTYAMLEIMTCLVILTISANGMGLCECWISQAVQTAYFSLVYRKISIANTYCHLFILFQVPRVTSQWSKSSTAEMTGGWARNNDILTHWGWVKNIYMRQ